jgi:hypothetical protein
MDHEYSSELPNNPSVENLLRKSNELKLKIEGYIKENSQRQLDLNELDYTRQFILLIIMDIT